jgi:DNA polymerase-4
VCPELQIFPPDHALYERSSAKMFGLLSEYSDLIEKFSIDECWLDYTASVRLLGDPLKTAHEIKERMKRELGFTINIGVSTNKLLAKMGSELEKPDKLHTLFPGEIAAKMWPLPVSELFFIGRATVKKLAPLGIRTIGDLAHTDIELLESLLKPAQAKLVHDYANGIDTAPVTPEGMVEQKGIGHATTTAHDVTDRAEAKVFLLALTEKVASRLRRHGARAHIVHIQIRRNDMTFAGKQRRVEQPIGTTDEIYAEAVKLLGELWKGEPLRQLGVSVSDFDASDTIQTSLFDAAEKTKLESIDSTVDRIRETFGERAITRGALIERERE